MTCLTLKEAIKSTEPKENSEPPGKKARVFQETPTGAEHAANVALYCVLDPKDSWMSKEEATSLGDSLNLDVLAVRIHAIPRKKYHSSSEELHSCRRLTVMIDEDDEVLFADHGADPCRNKDVSKTKWRGLSIYYVSEVRKPYDVYFLDTPVGLTPRKRNMLRQFMTNGT
jgi:hypothetical protein